MSIPPPDSKQVRCVGCKHYYPDNYFASSGHCWDCYAFVSSARLTRVLDDPPDPPPVSVPLAPVTAREAAVGLRLADPKAYALALSALTPKQRFAFTAHVVDGLSRAAVAERMGVGESAVSNHLRRAIDHFRNAGLLSRKNSAA